MSTTLPIPIEADVPQGWRSAPPDEVGAPDAAYVAVHLPPDAGFTANITVDGEYRPDAATLPDIADESVRHMEEPVAPVVVVDRREAGSADASGLTQTLAFSVVVGRQSHDLVQPQAYLAMLDVDDPHRRVVVRLVLTSTASQHSVLLDDFRDLVRTVRPGGGTTRRQAAASRQACAAEPVLRSLARMGLLDKLTGTRRPAEGVSPVPGEELRAALLGLDRPEVPYTVRYGGGEQCDLVAEWRLTEPAWQQVFVQSQISHAVRIRMRLDHQEHEVRAVEEQWELSRVGTPTRLEATSEYSRGPSRTVSRQWTFGRGADGGLEATETFRFDSAQMRVPLRDTALQSGWTWRGVVFGKL